MKRAVEKTRNHGSHSRIKEKLKELMTEVWVCQFYKKKEKIQGAGWNSGRG